MLYDEYYDKEYYEDCDCSVSYAGIRTIGTDYYVIVNLVDEKIKGDKELEEKIIKNLKTREWNKHYSKYGEPTEENLKCMSINPKELKEEIDLRATIYTREIELPKNSKEIEKTFEPWYINYIKLCRQQGVNPRECGVPGGAYDHYLQLQERQNPDTYSEYVKNLEYRAGYNENAFHDLVNLNVDDYVIPTEMGHLLHDIASSEEKEIPSLKRVIDFIKQTSKFELTIYEWLKALKQGSITFTEFNSILNQIEQDVKEAKAETVSEKSEAICEESVHEELDIDTIYQEKHNYDYNNNTQYVFA